MATFNFSTMQMTVKVVYYGPGLCGKTTNLQFIYAHTTPKSRGEMVSLETKSDRTLFFDLLPLEVGTIAGFKTKIQLYTVPGQVFYNTTRKLVLKGVDGIVFVADSQRPMLPSNVESLANLGANLSELGIVMDTVPLVFQYNKRDLNDVCSIDELNDSLNDRDAPAVEAAALSGGGVFETLRAISRLTLGALKKQLEEGPPPQAQTQSLGPRPTPVRLDPPAAAREPREAPTAPAVPTARPTAPPAASPTQRPAAAPPAASATQRPAAAPPAASPTQRPAAAATAIAAPKPVSPQPHVPSSKPARPQAPPQQLLRSDGKVSHEVLMRLSQIDFLRARRLSLDLRLEDGRQEIVRKLQDVEVELSRQPDSKEMLLQLNIRLNPDG